MRWPWEHRPLPPPPAPGDTTVADRLEEVAARLEFVAGQLAKKVAEFRYEEEADVRPE